MKKLYIFNSKVVKRLAKSLLVIVGLFIVYICGFATLIMLFGKNLDNKVFTLICVLVFFPLLVFMEFLLLLARYYRKSPGALDVIREEVNDIIEEKFNQLPKASLREIEDNSKKEMHS